MTHMRQNQKLNYRLTSWKKCQQTFASRILWHEIDIIWDKLSSAPCLCLVTQACLTLCDPVDCNLPGSFVHGIIQAKILEWVAILYSRGIFLTQGLNLSFLYLLHWLADSLPLSHLGSPLVPPHASLKSIEYVTKILMTDK